MAENVKITELDELVSGSLRNDTIFPVVDAGSTQKVSLITLTEYIDDFFASNSQLDNQISILSTDISNLNTSDIAESGNLYYTDTRVKNKLNVDEIVSSSSQIDLSSTTNYTSGIKTRLDAETVISSSTQIVSDYNLSINEIPFLYESNSVEGVSDMFTGSSNFTFDPTNDLLSVGSVSTTDITFDGDLTGVGFSTASFKLLLADSIGINTQYQLPTTDGIANQVIASDGSGNTAFQSIDTLIADSDLTTTGTITAGTASVTTDLTVDGNINDQIISSTVLDYQAQAVRLRSSGELILSSSSDEFGVQIDNVLVLPPRDTKPTTPPTGSIIVSASVSGPRPFFYDGTDWTQMF